MIPFSCLGDFSSKATDLQYVSVPFIDNAKCIKPHTVYDSHLVTSNMICAGNQENGGVGPCFGDGGGPLIVPDGSSEDFAVLYGMVSWAAASCALATEPPVFTRITPFVGWIRGHMKGMIFYLTLFGNIKIQSLISFTLI